MRWRQSSSAEKGFEDEAVTRDVPACREMVERLAKMDTSVDSTVHRETNEPTAPMDPKTQLALAGCAEAFGSLVKQNQAYRSYPSTEIDLIEIAREPGFREMIK